MVMFTAALLKEYVLSKPDAVEDFPFGPDTAVYRVADKMFALVFLAGAPKINLKCDPLHALELRAVFPCVLPGYHMNKKHWNTIVLDGTLPAGELQRMIDLSYALVVKGLAKKQRTGLELRYGKDVIYGLKQALSS